MVTTAICLVCADTGLVTTENEMECILLLQVTPVLTPFFVVPQHFSIPPLDREPSFPAQQSHIHPLFSIVTFLTVSEVSYFTQKGTRLRHVQSSWQSMYCKASAVFLNRSHVVFPFAVFCPDPLGCLCQSAL